MKLLILILAIATSLASIQYGLLNDIVFDSTNEGFQQANFTNLLDHFNPGDNRTFQQRFWYSTEGFDQEKGPIFVYICGEYECGVQTQRMFPYKVSKQFNASFFYLEHRFYGESQPFDNLSLENLRYLTSEHGLADLALFITSVNDYLVKKFGGEKRRVVVIGGSYPGALSAWFRAKYPHIADAAWASSAVVNAIEDFDMFDYQVYNSTTRSNLYCTQTVQNMSIVFDGYLAQGKREIIDKIKDSCGALHLTDGDFAYYFADMIAGEIQYGNRTTLCDFLESLADVPILDRYGMVAQYINASPSDYDREKLKNTTIVPSDSGRAWNYQFCTEFGYLQIPYPHASMRSHILEHDYWVDYCRSIYGKDAPIQTYKLNIEYGGDHSKGSNIYFVNGGEDPFVWSSQLESIEQLNIISDVLQCENCAHCLELYNEREDDSDELKQTRKNIVEWLKKIIN